MKEKNLACIAFDLWVKISIRMAIAIVFAVVLFIVCKFAFITHENGFFVSIFIMFLIVGMVVIYSEFKKIAVKDECLNVIPVGKYFIFNAVVLYILITWRALILLAPILGILVFFSKGDIIGRIYAIVFEFLVGYPSIYWYLKSRLKNFECERKIKY